MLYLDLFKKLDRMRSPTITVGTETKIFESYDQLIGPLAPQDRKTVVIAHCHDEVIMSRGLRANLTNLDRDLERNPNVHVILISCYDIEQHLPRRSNFLFIPFWEYHGIYWHLYENTEPADPSRISKRFLSLNKRADVYRQLLYYKFYHRGWLDDNIFSYLCEDGLAGDMFHAGQYQHMHDMIKDWPGMQDITSNAPLQGRSIPDDHLLQQYQSSKNDVDPTWTANKQWYDQTFCSIVIETDAGDDHVNLSEKTFRCVALQHPVMLFAAPNTHQFLKKLGLAMDDFFSWEDHGFLRLKNFFEEIESISNMDLATLVKIRYDMQERLAALRTRYSQLHGCLPQRQADISGLITAQIDSWGVKV